MSRPIPEHLSGYQSERALIGCLVLSRTRIGTDLVALIDADDFLNPDCRRIFQAAQALVDRGEPVDMLTLLAEANRAGSVIPAEFLTTCAAEVPATVNGRHYAKMVADAAIRREIIATGQHIATTARDAVTAEDAYEQASKAADMMRAPRSQEKSGSFRAALERGLTALMFGGVEAPKPVSTGFWELDDMMGGFSPGALIVVAGSTSLGKTALSSAFAFSAVESTGRLGLLFSMEMSAEEMAVRVGAARVHVNVHDLRRNLLSQNHNLLMTDQTEGWDVPLEFIDRHSMTVSGIRREAKSRLKGEKAALIVVDYLQQLKPEGKHETRQQAVAEMGRALKLLARNLDCPIVVCAQLNRAPDARSSKRPEIGDIRETGAAAMDADVVLLVYRDDFYHRDSPDKGKAEITVAKNRNGPTGLVTLGWHAESMSFFDLYPKPVSQETMA